MARKKKIQPAKIDTWLDAWAKRVNAVATTHFGYRYKVETICGPLYVKDSDGIDGGVWLACRFDDVDRAAKHFGVKFLGHRLNPYSGKWNFTEAIGNGSFEAVAYLLNTFEREVAAILP